MEEVQTEEEDGPYEVTGDGPLRGIFFAKGAPLRWKRPGETVQHNGVVYIIGEKKVDA